MAIDVPPRIKGLIFDLDGTIADTMPAHYKAWMAVLGEHDIEFPEALFYEFGGMPTPRIVEVLNERHNHNLPVMETALRKESLFETYLPSILPILPVVDVINRYYGKLPMGIATGAMRHVAIHTLKVLNLMEKFQTIVTADDVPFGKPAPDIFLEAARRISVPAADCMAFEDANLGIQAATAAGMLVLDVRPVRGLA